MQKLERRSEIRSIFVVVVVVAVVVVVFFYVFMFDGGPNC